MNLNEEINKISSQVIQDKLPAIIEKQTTELVQSVIKDLFSPYGDVAKKIKNEIEKSLDINLQNFNIVDYNGLVSQTINNALLESVNMNCVTELTKGITGFINKKEIDLSEIVDFVKNAAIENARSNEDCGEISFYVDAVYKGGDESKASFYQINFDLEETKKDSCSFRICVSEKGKIFSFQYKDYFNTKREPISSSNMVAFSRRTIENQIFRLYAADVTINIDYTNFDLEWSRYED